MSISQDADSLLADSLLSARVLELPAPHAQRMGFWEVARRAFPPQARKHTLKRLRYLARAWRHPRLHDEWLRFLDSPQFGGALAERLPQLYAKIQSTYALRPLDIGARVRLLQDHYRGFFCASRALCDKVHSSAGLMLWAGELDGSLCELRLSHLPLNWREGEISLGFFEGTRLICSLTFVVTGLHEVVGAGGSSLVIGGIQGMHDAEGLQVFRRLTKSMHGLRPFSLLIHAARAVAPALGARRVIAIGDAKHALAYKRANNRVHICYDDVWSEHGAAPAPNGLFDLGSATPLKPLDEIASNKRSQYRRRYELMDEMQTAIGRSIAAV
jgi:uncharacterized protein VirK/YbjX